MREEELKNRIGAEFFADFDCTAIIGAIDFAVKPKRPKDALDFGADHYLLWAEAKQKASDIFAMLTQLVLTIGKARTFDKILPPPFLGCFDYEKIAFVPYSETQDIFYQNDFNWNVTPSNHETKEFKQIYDRVQNILENENKSSQTYLFYFEKDEQELRQFIKQNFIVGKQETTKIKIDKNNFIIIYNKWLETVKPSIDVDWDIAKKVGVIDADFYLADLLSVNNETIKEKLSVLLQTSIYKYNRQVDTLGELFREAQFKDKQKAHAQFWAKYERPPLKEYWDYIIERRDLLVPQDVRERKGSFFTPQIWVELSQRYIADVLGDDWQDEYYVWDCAAGTGNLLHGLTNKYRIWASTLDKQDVDIMRDRIANGANLLESHVFQFDFLNDDFSKLPQSLQDIIIDESKRKKLIVYINPPYAETMSKGIKHKAGLNISMVNKKYISKMGNCANRELFVQFLTRIYAEFQGVAIANFSKLKNLQSPNFKNFRNYFLAKLEKLFIIPADTFDNVKGQFPIGFFIWNTKIKEKFKQITADIYLEENKQAIYKGQKIICNYDNNKLINVWLIATRNRPNENKLGFIACLGNDFQQNNVVFIINNKNQMASPRGSLITDKNLIEVAIYLAVRKVIPATWLNDRDQFLYPNDGWKNDTEFQNDCLAYTLFNNNIQSKDDVNHWIPFTEKEVDAPDVFQSHFMTDFIAGKIQPAGDFMGDETPQNSKREFSVEAQAVFSAGRELWKYYHSKVNVNVNASFYDIKEYFQGRNKKTGRMNNKSDNVEYNLLIANLRNALKLLAQKIEPKVYEYGFLKK